MIDRKLESIIPKREPQPVDYDTLMRNRVRNLLIVSSLYDSFTFEEDGRLTEALYSEYVELNLRYAPNIVRVSTASEALEQIRSQPFDLVVSMLRLGDMEMSEFGVAAHAIDPQLTVVLLAYNTRELAMLEALGSLPGFDRVFVWLGDVRLFLAIIKYVEDRMNVEHDSQVAGVQSIILIEDNVRFYSTYLPMLYTEIVQQTQALMADGLNNMDRLHRMRARPKILLATTYEEGEELFEQNAETVAGVILDASFPRGGKIDMEAGLNFARLVRDRAPDRPVLIQSSEEKNMAPAHATGASFINKQSPRLLAEVREFIRSYLGFGDFVFRTADGREIGRASDLLAFTEMISRIPDESLLFHARRNDFSTWLAARTEYDLAKALRPRTVGDFSSVDHVRSHITSELEKRQDMLRARMVSEFSQKTFRPSRSFVRIGSGSLGGKGRGLAFVHTLLERFMVQEQVLGLKISVPPTAVLATGVFDEFVQQIDLGAIMRGNMTDEEIAQRFLRAYLPFNVRQSLRTFLSRVHYPLAVRSSSLLEDASYQPFAGIYRTYMIPNNHSLPEVRLRQLENAIKLVYASTYYAEAKSYIDATPNRQEEEKMAVVIQEVAGKQRGQYIYPDIAGVARSYNFYPMDGMTAEEGVASVVLGLGKSVVDGGKTVRFSPFHPRRLYQFSSPEATLASAQRDFLALDMENPGYETIYENPEVNIVSLPLDLAEEHGVLPSVGSIYSPENHAVYDGTSRPGVRLVTMAGVLKGGVFPLAEALQLLLKIGSAAFSSWIEIEFAANIGTSPEEPNELFFLQIRPVVVGSGSQDFVAEQIDKQKAICVSRKALGNGVISDVRDLVYVPGRTFDRGKTVEIAQEIGAISGRLREQKRPFVLIGPGRWGSADRWLGIPVSWMQIAGVRCIIETDMADIRVTPSQGTHFFQNITSFGIAYFTVNFDGVEGSLDSEWLDAQSAWFETPHVRALAFEGPIEIAVSGKRQAGAVMKPGCSHIAREQ